MSTKLPLIENILTDSLNIYSLSEAKKRENVTRDFNIFTILDRERDETKSHSRFLGELLSPQGSHGLKELFLQIFISHLNKQANVNFTADDTSFVDIEKSAPWQGYGGRIDIRIETPNAIVIIENKIDAGDQPKQLERYYNYSIEHKPKSKEVFLIYLTLDGSEPSEQSLGSLSPEIVHSLSYKVFIKDFLDSCIVASSPYPLIQHTIVQYKHLIEKITGGSFNMATLEEVTKLIDSQDKLSAALLLAQATELARNQLELKFWEELEQKLRFKLKHDPNITVNFSCSNTYNLQKIKSGNYFGIYMKIGEVDNYDVLFGVNKENGLLFHGVRLADKSGQILGDSKLALLYKEMYEKIKSLYSDPHSNAWWVAWERPQSARNLNMKDVIDNEFIKLFDDGYRNTFLEKLATEMSELTINCKKHLKFK